LLDLIEPNFQEEELKHQEKQHAFESNCAVFEQEFAERDAAIERAS